MKPWPPYQASDRARYSNRKKIYEEVQATLDEGYEPTEDLYARIYHEHPFQLSRSADYIAQEILANPDIQRLYKL